MKRFLILALFCGSAHAEFYDGNELLRMMRGNHSEQMMALGYVVGVFDAHRSTLICPTSPNVTAGQANDIVRNYLDRTPQSRHLTGDVLTTTALMAVWPCNNRSGRTL